MGSAGTADANTLAGQDKLGGENFGFTQSAMVTNGYSAQFSWRAGTDFILSGWFGSYYPRLIGKGDGNILSYALSLRGSTGSPPPIKITTIPMPPS